MVYLCNLLAFPVREFRLIDYWGLPPYAPATLWGGTLDLKCVLLIGIEPVTGKRKTEYVKGREDRRASCHDDYGYLPVFLALP